MFSSWLEFILWCGSWGSLFGAAYYAYRIVKENTK